MKRNRLLFYLALSLLTSVTLPTASASRMVVGELVDLSRYARVTSWVGPEINYTGATLEQAKELLPKNGMWTVEAANGDKSVNIGLAWNEMRNIRRITIIYADAASTPDEKNQELQLWLNPERIPAQGGDTTYQGKWRALEPEEKFSAHRTGNTWVYSLPEIREGIYQFRAVVKDKKTVRVKSITAEGTTKWKNTEFEVRFNPARTSRKNAVEGFNAEIESIKPLAGMDGFIVKALASDAGSSSEDRAVFTVRAEDRSFSFLLNDLESDGRISIPAFGVELIKPGATARSTSGKTITQRVLEMPEQTFDGALNAIPPKKRNKELSLSPPLNPNKWAVRPNGDAYPRNEWDFGYSIATGDKPDFKRIEPQHVENDYLPVLWSEWEDQGLKWKQGWVTTTLKGKFDDPTQPTAIISKVSATNTGSVPVEAKLWLGIKGANDQCQPISVKDGILYERTRVRALIDTSGWGVQNVDAPLLFTVTIQPGETRSIEWEAPYGEWKETPAKTTFDQARQQTIDYWNAKLNNGVDFIVPDVRVNSLWKSLLIHQYCWGDYDAEHDVCLPNVSAWSYGPVGNESSQMCKALDFFGHSKMAQDYFKDMWQKQGQPNLPALCTNGDGSLPGWWGNYVFNTGFQTWNLCNHYRLTGDRAWLDMIIPNLIKACDWVDQQRKTTAVKDSHGNRLMQAGFFPPCSLEDEGTFRYWTMTNAYLYAALANMSDILTQIGHPDTGRITKAAQAYLSDLHTGLGEAIIRCPVVKLRDGSYVPNIPKELYRRGRTEGFYEAELSALHLLTNNVYAPTSPQMDWTLNFLEDTVFMTEAPSHDTIISLANMEKDWFALGGFGKTQPYLAHQQIAYLRRDQPKLFLRSFWNQLVAQNFSDINAFPEHMCWSGAAACKTYEEAAFLQQFRSMLVFDEDNILRLAWSAPREWLSDGKTISIKNAPSFFGTVSYEIHSQAAAGKISATVEFQQRREPQSFILRFRHPQELKMKRVEVNGKAWGKFNPDKETIELPAGAGKVEAIAYY